MPSPLKAEHRGSTPMVGPRGLFLQRVKLIQQLFHTHVSTDLDVSPLQKLVLAFLGGRPPRFATADFGGNVFIWDLALARPIRHFRDAHAGAIQALLFHGDLLATGGDDGILRVWCTRSGRLLHTLEGHSDCIECITIAGETLISGCHDGTVRTWHVVSGEALAVLQGHGAGVSGLEVCPDSEAAGRVASNAGRQLLLVTASVDKTMKLWETQSGTSLKTVAEHKLPISSLVREGNVVATGSMDGTARVYQIVQPGNFKSLSCCQVPNRGEFRVKDGGISEMILQQGLLFVAIDAGDVCVFDADNGDCFGAFEGHSKSVWAMCFEGHTLTTAGIDERLIMWDMREGLPATPTVEFVGHSHAVTSLALSGDFVLSADMEGHVICWDVRTQRSLHSFVGHRSGVSCLSLADTKTVY